MLNRIYDRVRNRLPQKHQLKNGVAVRDIALFDRRDVNLGYEAALVAGVRRRVRSGDRVVVVGGGAGVSTIVAARHAGPAGGVICYEVVPDVAAEIRRRAGHHGMRGRVDVRTAAVGPVASARGDVGQADRLDPADLPECDVLVLDCEGAESLILSEYGGRPLAIVVEVHPQFESTVRVCRRELDEGYLIERLVAHDDYSGVVVMEAVRTDSQGYREDGGGE